MRTAKKASLKSDTTLSKAETKEVHAKASGAILKLVERCLLAAKTTMQSINELEKQVSDTAIHCLKHAHDHGDVMPCDRLVKGLMDMNHPATTRLSQEVVAWFRANSPVRWDAKGNPKQLREGEEGYKPYDEEAAEETPFFDTAIARRARQSADAAHARELKPVTYQDVLNRLKGLRKFVTNAASPDKNGETRGIAKGEKTKILKLLASVEDAAGIMGSDATEQKEAA